ELCDRALALGVVAQRARHRDVARAPRRDAALDQARGVDQEPRADPFLEPARLELAHALAQLRQAEGDLLRDAALVCDHERLALGRRVIEVDGDEALARGLFEILRHAL